MKCEIIRDLLPSYIDNLTSDESNIEIKKHLDSCSECKNILDNMSVDFNEETIQYNKEKIKPLRKLNKQVLKSILITASICLLLFASYLYMFGLGWKVNSNKLNINYSYDDEVIWINLQLDNEKVLNVRSNMKDSTNTLVITECLNSIVDNRGVNSNKFTYGIHYKDENGDMKQFTDTDIIKLDLKDKTETLYLKEISEELGLQ